MPSHSLEGSWNVPASRQPSPSCLGGSEPPACPRSAPFSTSAATSIHGLASCRFRFRFSSGSIASSDLPVPYLHPSDGLSIDQNVRGARGLVPACNRRTTKNLGLDLARVRVAISHCRENRLRRSIGVRPQPILAAGWLWGVVRLPSKPRKFIIYLADHYCR